METTNQQPLSLDKFFRMSGAFEGGGYTNLYGNFDGNGLSFGFLRWTIGEGSLQTLIESMYNTDPDVFHRCCTVYVPLYDRAVDFTDSLKGLITLSGNNAMKWAAQRQTKHNIIVPHWREIFYRLGSCQEYQKLQRLKCASLIQKSRGYCREFSLYTEQAFALFFDTCVQQTDIRTASKYKFDSPNFERADYYRRLEIIAESLAKQAKDGWQRDILERRMCIARGGGIVRNKTYDLAADFDITQREIYLDKIEP